MVLDIDGIPAWISLPSAGSGPPVVVIQEWWGLVPHIVDVCDRLAAEGFVALAVDHYRGLETTEPDEAKKLMLGLDIERVAGDLADAAAYLVSRPEVVGDQVRCMGFCMGGGLALLAPTVAAHVCCTAAFYPAVPWPHYSPDWSRYAGKKATVHMANSDGNRAEIAGYAERIQAAGGQAVVCADYPDSVHAFFNDARPEVYQQRNAELAWSRTLELFRSC